MTASAFFSFEDEFVASLRCIPMTVRLKLDTCGVKLKLAHWNQFTQTERQLLVDLPCDTHEQVSAYRDYLQSRVVAHTGQPAKLLAIDPQPPWRSATVPDQVKVKAQAHQLSVSDQQWQSLSTAQRFALVKLSRPSHENRNFVPAMREFALA